VSVPLTPLFLGGLTILLVIAGIVNGIAGFGFALVGTMALATVIEPGVAVVFMIIPILSVNLSLVGELSASDLRSCGRRFAPLLGSALVGTVLGMVLIDLIPANPLRVLLGLVSLGFVVSSQSLYPVPGLDRAGEGCFVESTPAMVGVGGASGVLFGGTNVGVQLVAYLRSCDLSHGLFVGVVALVFLGLNGIRIGAAGLLGMYPSLVVIGVSVAAGVPAVAGVAIGTRLRERVSERRRDALVLGLLTVIGVRLVTAGTGIVG
jgi:uncharacterized membrane protein YfcA